MGPLNNERTKLVTDLHYRAHFSETIKRDNLFQTMRQFWEKYITDKLDDGAGHPTLHDLLMPIRMSVVGKVILLGLAMLLSGLIVMKTSVVRSWTLLGMDMLL